MIKLNTIQYIQKCRILVLLGAYVFLNGCENFVEVDPPRDEIVNDLVFSSDATLTSAVVGIYSEMGNKSPGTSFTNAGLEKFTGLSSDELISTALPSSPDGQFALNALVSTNVRLKSTFWADAYRYILKANTIIEGLNEADQVTDSVRNQIEGEAKFIRAYCHFYLVNLFGPIPFAVSTNFESNNTAARMPENEIYEQIVSDLLEARELMLQGFTFTNNERIRPNRGAAEALLARAYLYLEDWENAEFYSTRLIDNSGLYALESDLSSVFLANSMETIWQLQPVRSMQITPQIEVFDRADLHLREDLVDAFQPSDSRLTSWIRTVERSNGDILQIAWKYQNTTVPLEEYSTVLRLAEQYLIRAESRAQQGKIREAIADLDVIKGRAGLSLLEDTNPDISQLDLLLAIQLERRLELFTEGHRWMDLKRTGRANDLLSAVKEDWQSTDVLYPVPQEEIEKNPNLLPQNSGYN